MEERSEACALPSTIRSKGKTARWPSKECSGWARRTWLGLGLGLGVGVGLGLGLGLSLSLSLSLARRAAGARRDAIEIEV